MDIPPTCAGLDARRNQITSFVGPAQALVQVNDLIASARLVTLTGAGGVGKTRLSQEVAADLLDPSTGADHGFADGVWLVEFVAVRAAAEAIRAVGTALNLRETAERSPLDGIPLALELAAAWVARCGDRDCLWSA